MDFDDAIKAHTNWKTRLIGYLHGTSDKEFDPEVVCKDNLCELGKWIYGEGAVYENTPQYTELKDVHAKFHARTAELIKMIDSGMKEQAKKVLVDFNSDHSQMASKIVQLLTKMRDEHKKSA